MDAITGNDWSAFCNLSTLHDHWTMKPWSPGQAGYYWYITFDDPKLRDLVSRCQATLAHDGIDPVPLDGLHLTLLSVGKVNEVSNDQLSGIVDVARASFVRGETVRPQHRPVGRIS
ncbi:hypothetical protein ACLMAL_12575 [Nocardia sp. CWNU-33]